MRSPEPHSGGKAQSDFSQVREDVSLTWGHDPYDAFSDPYCYVGTTVLKNIPGIRNASELERFEAISTAQRAEEPLPSGRFSVAHYCAVHRHLFGDVYRWAGRFRSIRVSKGDSMFCYPENIAPEMRKLFVWLRERDVLRGCKAREFADVGAHFLSELNAIHPFRDGNGRAQLAFMALMSAESGNTLDFSLLDPEAFLSAMVSSFQGDEGPLIAQLISLLE